MTTSHLRFGPNPIRSTYLITRASFVACHNFSFLEKMNVLEAADARRGLPAQQPYAAAEVWDQLPKTTQEEMLRRRSSSMSSTATRWRAKPAWARASTPSCRPASSPSAACCRATRPSRRSRRPSRRPTASAAKRWSQKNFAAVDAALAHLDKVEAAGDGHRELRHVGVISSKAPDFVHDVLGEMAAGHGDLLPVSAMPAGGTFPTGTAQWEKRNIAQFIPVWDKDLCIQCGKCVMVCPHAVIRAKVYDAELGDKRPGNLQVGQAQVEAAWSRSATPCRWRPKIAPAARFCVEVCPAKSKSDASKKAINMAPQAPLREPERENWEFFLSLPEVDRDQALAHAGQGHSAACSRSSSSPAPARAAARRPTSSCSPSSSATGSISPTPPAARRSTAATCPPRPTPATRKAAGPPGPTRCLKTTPSSASACALALDQQKILCRDARHAACAGNRRRAGQPRCVGASAKDRDRNRRAARARASASRRSWPATTRPDARNLLAIADSLVRKSVWILGGDGWAYDIGFGGLDHVLGSGKNVNVLVLDTEVYSNTGGQMSKATPRGAVAKFAASGKPNSKKDLAMEAVAYGSVYVAQVAMGGNDSHVIKAFQEAEAHDGPVAHHRLLPLHRPRLRPDLRPGAAEGWPCNPATGR